MIRLRRLIPQYSLRTLFVLVTVCAFLLGLWVMLTAPDDVSLASASLQQCGADVFVFRNRTDGADGEREAWVKLNGLTLSKTLSARICWLDELVPITRLECDNTRIERTPQYMSTTGGLEGPPRTALQFLHCLKHVKYLSARHSDFTDDEINDILGASQISCVYLNDSKVAIDKPVLGLKYVDAVDLSGTLISDASLNHIPSDSHICSLVLERTAITDRGMASIARFERLRDLDVSETAVSDIGIASVKHMRDLQLLDVSGTRVTFPGLVTLLSSKTLTIYASGAILTDVERNELLRRFPDSRVVDADRTLTPRGYYAPFFGNGQTGHP